MNYQGVLRKMHTEHTQPIQYYLEVTDSYINMNQLIDKKIHIEFLKYQCLACGENKKIHRQGYCYDDFYKAPQVADWVMKPELSKAHLNIEDRDLDYEKNLQLQPHIVYLANSSNVKVGVTRKQQIPTRWIDQGAHEALEIVEVPNRYLAGITEVALKKHVADKTNWRTMLKNEIEDVNLKSHKNTLKKYIPEEVQQYFIKDNEETQITFPVRRYPEKLKTLNLDKTPAYDGVLKGIKGQYLLFEDDTVFNVRSWEGYVVRIDII